MDKRTLLAIVLSLAVLLVYQIFFVKPPEPQKLPADAGKIQQTTKETAAKAVDSKPVLVKKKTIAKKDIAAKEVKVETPLYSAVFSTRGAALKSFKLKKYQEDCASCAEDIYPRIKSLIFGSAKKPHSSSEALVELVNVKEGMPYPLTVTFPQSSVDIDAESGFNVETGKLDLTNTKEKQRIVFSGTFDGTMKVEKIYTFHPDNYTIGLEVKLSNLTRGPLTQTPTLSWQQYVDPQKEGDGYGHEGPVASVAKSIKREEAKKIDKEKILGPDTLWSGFESKYFIASFIPENPSLTSVIINRDAQNVVSVGIYGQKEIIPAGQSNVIGYTLYLGPKSHELLKKLNVGLENSINFGWTKWLAIVFLAFLKFLHAFVYNYGMAIIILSILIKILFWPLGNLSYKSMKEMQKIQPKLNELKEKYKNDQAKLGQETMALYRAHKINPLSGCLPLLIQLPVFIGLYNALMYSIELRHAPFFFWIQDLSAKDPYYITPIVMGLTQFIQQKMTPAMGDPMQAKIMMLMPLILTIFFLNFPSGLVIYWLINNVLSIGQQFYINKKLTD
jgi:YidC/Oxa1 family membrane protein insertase